ncbi:hypothetical protein [Solirubrobacter deserti]|uniref:Ig-like domain-containing protein n=1 Tax=Solirubrobacter deserti TaxID=2282478 RepID=A0ABT4RIZ1_9ACTN|nr:hypothetical protein [Solirubrobacter deserti]MDA0138514.1 hypothetical protein [Solirubrobacter deserti]
MFGAVIAALLILASPAQAAKPPAYDTFELVSRSGPPPGPTSGSQTPEIADVTPDGMRLFTTLGERGFSAWDLSDPAKPKFQRTIGIGNGAYVTSVNVTPDGRHLLVTQKASGTLQVSRLSVFDARTLAPLVTWPLAGQPDGVAISPDGQWALIAIENEPAGVQGELARVRLEGTDPADWEINGIAIDATDPALANPNDLQPEFIDIRPDNTAVVTLQENNAVAVVDIPGNAITDIWSAGRTDNQLSDRNRTPNRIAFTDPLTDRQDATLGAPREPDAIGLLPGGEHVILANEGEAGLGGRSFTIHALDGTLVYDSKERVEKYLADRGLYPDDRSTSHGAEFEGVDVGTYGRTTVAAIGAERGDAVVFVDVTDPTQPKLMQALPSGGEPEGILAVPQRNLLLTVDAGNPRGFTVFRAAMRRDLPDGRRQIAAADEPLYRLHGLTAVDSTRLAVLHGGSPGGNAGPGAILEVALRRTGGEATGVKTTPITLDGAPVNLDYGGDLARDPRTGGWWVASPQGVLRVAPDGTAEKVHDAVATGLAVTRDGGTVFLEAPELALIAYDVAARTTRTFVRPTSLARILDLATAPDGALVALTGEGDFSEPRMFDRSVWRVPVAGLADGATLEPQVVTTIGDQPLFADFGLGDQTLAVTPSGDVWVTGETSILRNLGRLLPPARPGAPASGAMPSDRGHGIGRQARDMVTGLLGDGPRVYATGDYFNTSGLSGLVRDTGSVAVVDPLVGALADGWPRVDGTVTAIVSDGAGGVYLSGSFTRVGETARAGLAHIRADGTVSGWAPAVTGAISALAVRGGTVYLGGASGVIAVGADGAPVAGFTPVAVTGGVVQALTVDGDRLYVGGQFTRAGDATHTRLARADAVTGAVDHTWAPTAAGALIDELVVSGTRLFVAGNVTTVNGTARRALAAIRTDDAGTLDTAFIPTVAANSIVRGLAVGDGVVYVSTATTVAGLAGPVYAVDATTGATVPGFGVPSASTGTSGGPLLLAGATLWHASPAGRLTALDADTGQLRGAYATVSATQQPLTLGGLAAAGSRVVVGGSFDMAGIATHAFAFDARTGEIDRGFALAGVAPRLLAPAGGWLYFVAQDGSALRRADPEDGGIDESFALEVAGSIHALAARGDQLLVGGEFTFLDGVGRLNLAALDARTGRVQPGLVAETDGRVLRVFSAGDRVYAVSRVAVDEAYRLELRAYDRDGAAVPGFEGELPAGWDAVDVLRADADGALLVAGGALNGRSGAVVRLDAATGRRLSGFAVTTDGHVTAVERHGGAVFVAGRFTSVGGVERRGLAAVDAATGATLAGWDAQADGNAFALYSHGPKLWIGGWFVHLGGTATGALGYVQAEAPVNVEPPAIGATARVGETVSCSTGTWRNFPASYVYSWSVDGASVPGVATATYTIPESAAGKALTCSVTATNDAGAGEPAVSAPVTVPLPAPINTAAPAISGTAKRGEALTCSTGEWTRTPTAYARRWLRGGVAIGGATGETHVATAEDVGRALTCQVVATNAGGDSAPAASAAVTVLAREPEAITAPSVAGTAAAGAELRCEPGTWSDDPTGFAYVWLVEGAEAATGATWTVPAGSSGRTVRCGVVASNATGSSAQALSAPVTVAYTPGDRIVLPAPTTRKPVRAKLGKVSAGRVSVEVTCPDEGERCRGRIELKQGARVVGRATYNVRAGEARVVKVKVPKSARNKKLKLVLRAS